MLGIRDYNRKIISLRNTRKITSSMKMIASVHMRRTVKAQQAGKPFLESAKQLEHRLFSFPGFAQSLFAQGHALVSRVHLVLFTSNRGLCGQCNANAIQAAVGFCQRAQGSGWQAVTSFVGARGHLFFERHGFPVGRHYDGIASRPSYEAAGSLTADLLDAFTGGAFQEIWLVYNRRVSALAEEPVTERLLPFPREGDPRGAGEPANEAPQYLVDAKANDLVSVVAPLLVRARLYHALLESAASEHAARMSAMDSATSNCDRLIQRHILLRNRARQAAVTTELSEIVGGKEAMQKKE